jgi:hypothetical protein
VLTVVGFTCQGCYSISYVFFLSEIRNDFYNVMNFERSNTPSLFSCGFSGLLYGASPPPCDYGLGKLGEGGSPL